MKPYIDMSIDGTIIFTPRTVFNLFSRKMEHVRWVNTEHVLPGIDSPYATSHQAGLRADLNKRLKEIIRCGTM